MTVIFRFFLKMDSMFLWELRFLFSLYATVRNVTGLYLNFNELRGGYLEPSPSPPAPLERSPYWLLSLQDQYFMSLDYSCDPGGKCPSIWERDHWKPVVSLLSGGFPVEESAFPPVTGEFLQVKRVHFYLRVNCLLPQHGRQALLRFAS